MAVKPVPLEWVQARPDLVQRDEIECQKPKITKRTHLVK
jgi:hypothetical protein